MTGIRRSSGVSSRPCGMATRGCGSMRVALTSEAALNDVDKSTSPTERNDSKFGKSNGYPGWFERGQTLQELIAPKKIEFFNENWVSIGSKASLADMLRKVTHIPREVLLIAPTAQHSCIAQIMS